MHEILHVVKLKYGSYKAPCYDGFGVEIFTEWRWNKQFTAKIR